MKKLYILIICVFISFCLLLTSFIMPGADLVSVSSNSGSYYAPVVIIDAGHGGFDGGASARDGTIEKDINLKISLYLDAFLNSFGYKTIKVRETDVSVEDEGLTTIKSKKTSDLHNRMKLMEETDNAIFVSIHQNSYPQEKYSGTQVFYSPAIAEHSKNLAFNIQKTITEALQPENNRQIKECSNSVFLIYNAVKPAVLVECGFLSNYNEAQLLKTDLYQRKIAFSIAIGIQKYISSRNENNG